MAVQNPVRSFQPTPSTWEAFGHSYMGGTLGTYNQNSHFGNLIRNALNIEQEAWRNHGISGAQLILEGRQTGGFNRIQQELLRTQRSGPYAAQGGGTIFCYGINDVGNQGNTTQVQNAFSNTLLMAISRARASSIRPDSDGSIVWGGGWPQAGGTQTFSAGTTIRNATTTTSATGTITIPADYTGTPIGISFVGAGGVFGGTVTFSGTAGVTGTLSTSNITPSASGSHGVAFRRITNLTAANAGQTIIMTVSQLDASGAVGFDEWWIEAPNPGPVIVCNMPRLPQAGYQAYSTMSAFTKAQGDAMVATWNGLISSVVSQFDSMVQVADLDAALNQPFPTGITSWFTTDSLHPNDYGAALCAEAVVAAVQNLKPTIPLGRVLQMNTPANRASSVRRPRLGQLTTYPSGNYWYEPEYGSITTVTFAVGTMWAVPMWVSEGAERWIQYQVEVTTAAAGATTPKLRFGLYDDIGPVGYPGALIVEATASLVLDLGITTGLKQSPASGSGSLNQPLEAGLTWLVMKCDVAATTTQPVLRAIQGPNFFMPTWSGTAGGTVGNVAWQVTGQTAGAALPGAFPQGATPVTACPRVGIIPY